MWMRMVRLFAPPHLLEQLEMRRRVQLLVGASLTTVVMSAARARALDLAGLTTQAWVVGALALAAVVCLVVLRTTAKVSVTAHLLIAVIFITIASSAWQRGGISSRVMLALGAFPVIATFLSGSRAGVVWLVQSLLLVAVFVVAEMRGVVFTDQLPPAQHLRVHAAGTVIFIVAMSAIGFMYESTRIAAMRMAVQAEVGATKATEEARMSRMERMAALGQLAAGVAHEINNPLAYLTANLQFIQDHLERGADAANSESVIDAATEAALGLERISVIVRDLKTFAREGNDDEPTSDARRVVASVVRLTRKQASHFAEVVVDDTTEGADVFASISEAKLAQVLLNLLLNALQAYEDDQDAEAGTITVRLSADAEQCTIAVSDDGCGMSAVERKRATEPFFTTKPVGVGTGLGLSVCHNLVMSAGGRLDLDSIPERGTTVTVVLPRTDEAPPSPPPHSIRVQPSASAPRRVLVVDDERLVLRGLRRAMHEHEVETAQSAVDALDLLGEGAQYDVVLCDMMMPRMTGAQLHQRVAELNPEMARRFVFLTGGVYGDAERTFLEEPGRVAITKPVTSNDLRDLLAKLPTREN